MKRRQIFVRQILIHPGKFWANFARPPVSLFGTECARAVCVGGGRSAVGGRASGRAGREAAHREREQSQRAGAYTVRRGSEAERRPPRGRAVRGAGRQLISSNNNLSASARDEHTEQQQQPAGVGGRCARGMAFFRSRRYSTLRAAGGKRNRQIFRDFRALRAQANFRIKF